MDPPDPPACATVKVASKAYPEIVMASLDIRYPELSTANSRDCGQSLLRLIQGVINPQ